MNTLEKLRGKQAHLKVNWQPKPISVKVVNVEISGLWVDGSPIMQAVVQAGAVSPPQALVVFVPFETVEYVVAVKEPGL
jgi:hypothetical protein